MKKLIEDHFALSTKLLRKDLKKARSGEPGVKGFLNIVNNGRSGVLDYKIQYDGENTYLEVYLNAEPQKILLSHEQLTFGRRTYLTCACTHRVNNLYLKATYFACRTCQNLTYKSTRISHTSDLGILLHEHNKMAKLMDLREKIERMLYRSEYTQKFKRYLRLCLQVGRMDEIQNVSDLLDAIQKRRSQRIKANSVLS